jgi:hypothetical protein
MCAPSIILSCVSSVLDKWNNPGSRGRGCRPSGIRIRHNKDSNIGSITKQDSKPFEWNQCALELCRQSIYQGLDTTAGTRNAGKRQV